MDITKELKKMSRAELLDLLLESSRENEVLKKQVQTLSEQIASRELLISKAGSIAEASLQLSGIFNAAQDAADTYLLSLQKTNENSEQILQRAKAEAAQIKKDAERQSAALIDSARRQAAETKAQSEKEITEMLKQAKEMIDSGWNLSLYTCTPGGASRVTVRCDRVEK